MAIAFEAASSGIINGVSSTSHTIAHTCTGDDRVLIVTLFAQFNGDNVSGVTYNSVAMAQIAKKESSNGAFSYMYGLVGPATGENDIVISFNNTILYSFVANASYTGVSQTGLPDASATDTGSDTTIQGTVTTTVDNCWTVMGASGQNGGLSAGTDTTIRATSPTLTRQSICDRNADISPAGSSSLIVNCNNDVNTAIIASMAPAVASFTPTSIIIT